MLTVNYSDQMMHKVQMDHQRTVKSLIRVLALDGDDQGQIFQDFVKEVNRVHTTLPPETNAEQARKEKSALLKHVITQWPHWRRKGEQKYEEQKQKALVNKETTAQKRKADQLQKGTEQVHTHISSSHTTTNSYTALQDTEGRLEWWEGKAHVEGQLQGELQRQGKGLRRHRHSRINKLHSQNQSLLSEIQNLKTLGVAETQVHNITDISIPQKQIEALAYGINFIPTPLANKYVIDNALNKFTRTVRLRWHFKNKECEVPKWHIRSPWEPPEASEFLESQLETLRKTLEDSIPDVHDQNWSSDQEESLKDLLDNPELLVITADKNLGYVICTVDWYKAATEKHLQDANMYEEVTEDFLKHDEGHTSIFVLFNRLCDLIERYRDYLPENVEHWILQKGNFTPMKFYITAKVHKLPVQGRPIAPSMNWITFHLSEYVADELNQYKKDLHTVLQDSTDFVNCLEKTSSHTQANKLDNIWLVGLDITAMYPNIDITLGLQLMQQFLMEIDYKDEMNRKFLMEAMHFILTEGYLTWDNKIYRQMNGAAMGSPFAPPYADIFMYMLERDYINKMIESNKLLLYKRYLDDVFAIIHGKKETAEQFVKDMNQLKPEMIALTGGIGKDMIFLDVKVNWNCRSYRFDTQTFQKPMNKYPYLPYKSFHTKAMKKGFIKGEAIRYARLSSRKKHFTHLISLFTVRLMKRGYPKSFIEKSLSTVEWEKRHLYLKYREKDSKLPLLFPIEYNHIPGHKNLRNALNKFTELVDSWDMAPASLKGKITVCYSLPDKLHKVIVKKRAHKGF